jgi:hypothetical protein
MILDALRPALVSAPSVRKRATDSQIRSAEARTFALRLSTLTRQDQHIVKMAPKATTKSMLFRHLSIGDRSRALRDRCSEMGISRSWNTSACAPIEVFHSEIMANISAATKTGKQANAAAKSALRGVSLP